MCCARQGGARGGALCHTHPSRQLFPRTEVKQQRGSAVLCVRIDCVAVNQNSDVRFGGRQFQQRPERGHAGQREQGGRLRRAGEKTQEDIAAEYRLREEQARREARGYPLLRSLPGPSQGRRLPGKS